MIAHTNTILVIFELLVLAIFIVVGIIAVSRMVPKATVLALVVVGTLFIVQTWIAGLIWPDHTTFQNPDTAFYAVAEAAGGVWLKYLVAFATAVAWGIGDGLVAQAVVARLLYSMARDKMMPSILGKIHPVYKRPYVSTIFVVFLAIAVGLLVAWTN